MIKKQYVWKELTEDGLLKKPPSSGPYYSRDDRLQYSAFDDEQSAVELLEDYIKVNDLQYWFADLVLVLIYTKE